MNNIEELRNHPNLIKDVNGNVSMLWQKFDNIISMRKVDFNDADIDTKVNEVFQNFVEIIKFVPLMATYIEIPQVVRARANFNGEMFTNQGQISYNTECPGRIAFGRFNQKGEPLFYGSLPTESKNVDYVLSCALECCKELTAGDQDFSYRDITVGGWLVNSAFPAVNLCFDEGHLNENPSLKVEMQKYLGIIEECFSKEATDFIKAFLHYFSELSGTLATSDFHYIATTALFHAIRYYYSEIVNEPKYGLIYPGAMSEKKGLNIVLTRDAVDRFLTLDKVVMFRYNLVKPENNKYVAYPCSDMVHPIDRQFSITNFVVPGDQLLTTAV